MPPDRSPHPLTSIAWVLFALATVVTVVKVGVIIAGLVKPGIVPATVSHWLIIGAAACWSIYAVVMLIRWLDRRNQTRSNAQVTAIRSLHVWLEQAEERHTQWLSEILGYAQQTTALLSDKLPRGWDTATQPVPTVAPDDGPEPTTSDIAAQLVDRLSRHTVQPTSGRAPGDGVGRVYGRTAAAYNEDTVGFTNNARHALDDVQVDSVEQAQTGLDPEVIRLGKRISRRIQGGGTDQTD